MEEYESLSEKVLLYLKENIFIVSIGFLGMILLGYGLIYLFSQKTPQNEFELPPKSSNITLPPTRKIMVDVEGEVKNPGVYKIDLGARIQDAILLAGGMSEKADKMYIQRTINLAAKLTDGEKVYIPATGEESVHAAQVAGVSAQNTAPVNINTATEKELDDLPGVGPVTAGKIIDGRPYQNISDLLDKKIVSGSVYEKIKNLVSVY